MRLPLLNLDMSTPLKQLVALAACFTVVLPIAGGQAEDLYQWSTTGSTMGTVPYSVKTFSSQQPGESFESAVTGPLNLVNNRMSTYKPDSELSRFNLHRGTDWFPVSHETAYVVGRALEFSRASSGAFDVTIGPLVNLWQFGPNKDEFAVPSDQAISEAAAKIGYDKLAVRLDPPSLKKSHPELAVDLSAIAKGYAVDLIAQELTQLGVENYLIEVGGEVRTLGQKAGRQPWRIGVESPVANRRDIYRTISLQNASLASSGDYRNFYVLDGKRYSHTIDPRSGRPVDHKVAAVSVIAGDCLTADAAATALMVVGIDGGLDLASAMGVEALIIERVGSALVDTPTPGFPRAVESANDASDALLPTIGAAVLVFVLAVVAMSLGVALTGRRIRGSCGGIAALDNPDVTPECSLCQAPSSECRELKKELQRRGLTKQAE